MNPLYRDVLPGGAHGSLVLRRGRLLRLTDVEGGANLALLAWNTTEKSERLNLPDALKCQHTSKLTRGHCLYSDMGRVLLCITNDDLGWHDPMGGLSTAAEVRARYGAGDYQTLRNDFYRSSASWPAMTPANCASCPTTRRPAVMSICMPRWTRW